MHFNKNRRSEFISKKPSWNKDWEWEIFRNKAKFGGTVIEVRESNNSQYKKEH